MASAKLYIKEIKGKGRAVFSAVPLAKDELIEESPLIAFPPEDFDYLTSTHVVNYTFFLDKEKNTLALGLGFISLYNHGYPCNAHHQISQENQTISIIALRDIRAHEEITINYNGDPDNDSLKWFASRDIEYLP